MCVNQVEYEDNYADNYDNEILQDQQGGEWSLVLLLLFTMKDFSCLISWKQSQWLLDKQTHFLFTVNGP